MKLIRYKTILQFALVLIIGMSCSESGNSQENQNDSSASDVEQEETKTGIAYQFVEHGTGEVPPDGGFWRMNLAYYDHAGKKLFSSEDRGGTMPMNYMSTNLKKNSSIEECFSLLGRGDSAVFTIVADSLFKNSYGRPTPPEMVGTDIKLYVGIVDVYSTEQFENYTNEQKELKIAQENATITEYLNKEEISANVTEEGIYYQILEVGTGAKPLPGQRIKVKYTGYNLDGSVFDSSDAEISKEANIFNPGRTYGPIGFALGKGEVIKGWDIGIALLSVGGKAKLIIPSPLAYGNQAMGASIKANSILVFDVELVEIEK